MMLRSINTSICVYTADNKDHVYLYVLSVCVHCDDDNDNDVDDYRDCLQRRTWSYRGLEG
jgi:hypothetical protein